MLKKMVKLFQRWGKIDIYIRKQLKLTTFFIFEKMVVTLESAKVAEIFLHIFGWKYEEVQGRPSVL